MPYIISMFLISIAVPLLLSWLGKSKVSKIGAMRYPKFITALSIICMFMILGLYILAWNSPTEHSQAFVIFVVIVSACYVLLFAGAFCLLLLSLNWRLVLDEEYMVHRNIFGVVKKIKYEDVTKITKEYNRNKDIIQYKVFAGKHKIRVDYFVLNFDSFGQAMKKSLKKAQNKIQF